MNDTTHGREPGSAIESALRALLDLYGPAMLFEPDRLATDLREQHPEAAREIPVLIEALAEQVPQDLLGAHTDADLQQLLPQLVLRLSDRKSLTPEASAWAVRTWARGLGLAVDAAGALPAQCYAGAVGAAGPEQDRDAGVRAPAAPRREPPRSRRRRFLPWIAAGATLVTGIAIWNAFFNDRPAITQVATSTPLVGDGKKREVFVTFKANRADVKNLEIRFVRGDGAWNRRPLSIEVPPEAVARGRIAAGQIALHATRPATATFAYVLVAANGERSAPFEKTFEFAPAPMQPAASESARPAMIAIEPSVKPAGPVITSISVPRPLVAGRPFAVTIAYRDGAGTLDRIERKVIESTARWQPETSAVETSTLPRPAPGLVRFPFHALRGPSRSTLEFTLVDRDGVRSEPQRVTLDVVSPRIRPASTACTSAICGRVISVNEIEAKTGGSRRGGKSYEVTVRTDNGTLHILTQSTRWKPGTRVRVIANTLTKLNS